MFVCLLGCRFPPDNWVNIERGTIDVVGKIDPLEAPAGDCSSAPAKVVLYDIISLYLSPSKPSPLGTCEVDVANQVFSCTATTLPKLGYALVAVTDDADTLSRDCWATTGEILAGCAYQELTAQGSACANNAILEQGKLTLKTPARLLPRQVFERWAQQVESRFPQLPFSILSSGVVVTRVTTDGAAVAGAKPYLPQACRTGERRCAAAPLHLEEQGLSVATAATLTDSSGLWLGIEALLGPDSQPTKIPINEAANVNHPSSYGAFDCSESRCFEALPAKPFVRGEVGTHSQAWVWFNQLGTEPRSQSGQCGLQANLDATIDAGVAECPQ